MNWQQWSLRGKIVIVGVALPAVLVGFLLMRYAEDSRRQTVDAFFQKAKAICLTAESTREEMEHKWATGLFTREEMRRYADQGRQDALLATVPVVTAWRAAQRQAEEGGYTFKVPKVSPRNPENEPDAFESRVLKKIKAENLNEYAEVDPKINAVRYFRAVRLSQSCLACHGNPATSGALWGNDKGMDPTGGPMENWKAGEVHGAFEIIQSLDAADLMLAGKIRKAVYMVLIGFAVMAVIFATLAVGIVTRSVIRPIRRVSEAIGGAAKALLDASRHVSSSSSQLADGAVNQAASLEESSAALEEVTSMTHSNAEHVRQTSEVAEDVRRSAETAQSSMEKMTEAVASIKDSSDKTVGIVKTIDEIAFQTNLLSLNAAVEAARAGEAGAGFAVVADEVRNLALRSAQAAKETTELIETAKANSDRGVEAAGEVKEILTRIIDGVKEVSTLARQIATASKEQAEGVRQVNIGVTEIDKVTQANAAVSEEAASASEELTGQAKELEGMVAHLARIVGAEKRGSAPAPTVSPARRLTRKAAAAPTPLIER